MNDDKLLETIVQFEVPKGYRMWAHEPLLIWDAVKGDWVFAITYAFRYGFLKGQRAAKAEAKREKKRLLERDTSGWYAYLPRWLERNNDNQELIQKLGTRARILEELLNERDKEEQS